MAKPMTATEPCPKCGHPKSEVIESWTQDVKHIPHIVKLHKCKKCGHEFTKSTAD